MVLQPGQLAGATRHALDKVARAALFLAFDVTCHPRASRKPGELLAYEGGTGTFQRPVSRTRARASRDGTESGSGMRTGRIQPLCMAANRQPSAPRRPGRPEEDTPEQLVVGF